KWTSFVANSGIRQIFGINDPKTAEFISKYMGEETVFVKSDSENLNIGNLGIEDKRGASQSYSERGRALKTPNELLTMDDGEQIIIQQGHHPIISRKIAYYKDEAFSPL